MFHAMWPELCTRKFDVRIGALSWVSGVVVFFNTKPHSESYSLILSHSLIIFEPYTNLVLCIILCECQTRTASWTAAERSSQPVQGCLH